jgi:hypothetical protein
VSGSYDPTICGLLPGMKPRSRGRRDRATCSHHASEKRQVGSRRRKRCTTRQEVRLRRGESQERCRHRLLGREGMKPSRGYPNPEGGTADGVETVRTTGSSGLTCAEGTRKSRRGVGSLRRFGQGSSGKTLEEDGLCKVGHVLSADAQRDVGNPQG